MLLCDNKTKKFGGFIFRLTLVIHQQRDYRSDVSRAEDYDTTTDFVIIAVNMNDIDYT